jgi:hypothetical protein
VATAPTKVAPKVKAARRGGRLEEDVRFDVRLRQRNLREGVLSRADVEKHLKSLPDSAAKAETLGKGE